MLYKGVELCCPHCKGDLRYLEPDTRIVCTQCERQYAIIFDIPDLRVFPDPYIDIEADIEKGLKIARRFDDFDFEGLIDYYYSITDVVPPQHAALYKRGLLSAPHRSQAALGAWKNAFATGNDDAGERRILEIGCGTAPLLVAAARSASGIAGVDIAFRWLVVAKKRLSEAGLDLPLICACAEALPFPDATFDRVLAESTVEHLKDPLAGLQECHRVLRTGGGLFLSTPNRFSLGPDPQTGIPAGSLLPDRLNAWIVTRQGGIPPRRSLLTLRSLRSLLRRSGFMDLQVFLPNIPPGQRDQFGGLIRRMIDLYHLALRLAPARYILLWIGPLLLAVARKGPATGTSSSRPT